MKIAVCSSLIKRQLSKLFNPERLPGPKMLRLYVPSSTQSYSNTHFCFQSMYAEEEARQIKAVNTQTERQVEREHGFQRINASVNSTVSYTASVQLQAVSPPLPVCRAERTTRHITCCVSPFQRMEGSTCSSLAGTTAPPDRQGKDSQLPPIHQRGGNTTPLQQDLRS